VLFDAEGEAMTPTHAVKKGVRYRHYVSRRLFTDVRASGQREQGEREQGQRLPAAEEDESNIYDLLRPLIIRAQVHPNRIDIELARDRLTDALLGDGGPMGGPFDSNGAADPDASAVADDDRRILLQIEARLQRAGMEMRFAVDGVEIGAPPDKALVRLLMRA
jgi:site-specific DNA recombinase